MNEFSEDFVFGQFPNHLAEHYSRLLNSLDEPAVAHGSLLDLMESFVQFCAIIGLLGCLAKGEVDDNLKEQMPQLERPSFGIWLGILRRVAQKDLPPPLNALERFLKEPIPSGPLREGNQNLAAMMNRLFGTEFRAKGAISRSTMLDLVVHYRNRVSHGAQPNTHDVEEALRHLLACLQALFQGADFMQQLKLIFVHNATIDRNKQVQHRWTDLTGIRIRKILHPYVTAQGQSLSPMEIYLCQSGQSGIAPLFSLYPLMVFSTCEVCYHDRIFAYGGLAGKGVSYVSQACTHQYRPKEHLQDVRSLVSGKHRGPGTANQEKTYTDEDGALNMYKSAVEKVLEDGIIEIHERAALDFLKQSMEISQSAAEKIEQNCKDTHCFDDSTGEETSREPAEKCTIERYVQYIALDEFLSPDPRELVSGDTPVALSDLRARAIDLESGADLHLENVKNAPCAKGFRIYFPGPLEPGEPFSIEFRCWWFESHMKRLDYIFFPMHLHPRGTDMLEGLLTLPERAAHAALYRHDGMKLVAEEIEATAHEHHSHWTYTWTFQPETAAYVVELERWSEGEYTGQQFSGDMER